MIFFHGPDALEHRQLHSSHLSFDADYQEYRSIQAHVIDCAPSLRQHISNAKWHIQHTNLPRRLVSACGLQNQTDERSVRED